MAFLDCVASLTRYSVRRSFRSNRRTFPLRHFALMLQTILGFDAVTIASI